MDNRLEVLAKNLVNYSCNLQKNEKILIEAGIYAQPLINEIIKQVYNKGGFPFVKLKDSTVTKQLLLNTTKEHSSLMAKYDKFIMEDMDAYIGITASNNLYELTDISKQCMQDYSINYQKPVHHETRVPKTKWVILQYPTPSFAQQAGKSTQSFEDFYFNVCNLDYQNMNKKMDNLKALMEKTDRVKIIGKDTFLEFSIKGINAVKCAGEMNIPDGEVYTAPIKDSVNGTITFNIPSVYNGIRFENIKLTFKDGKIVNATSLSNTDKLNEILDTDEGARYIGEFSLGLNPYILHPMLDILFDEKIAGSFHFTPGGCYDDAFNGNKSAVHWDMVCVQRSDYGGGEIWFDDKLIRKDGLFVLEELLELNPENLK